MAITSHLPPQLRPAVRDALMQHLYIKDAQAAQEELYAILDEHRKLTNSYTMNFMYLNRVFHTGMNPKPLIAPALHPDLYERMNAYLLDRQRVDGEEKLIVKNLFTAAMNVSDYADDWIAILPPTLGPIIQRQLTAYFSIEWHQRKLTDSQVEIWQKKHERALNMLKGRMTLNLIF